jgi:hypothetical protein
MRNDAMRTAARRLMAFVIRISPSEARDWAAAMSAELDYVESSFHALLWALGCVGIMLKQLCVSLFTAGRKEPGSLLPVNMPGSEDVMRKFMKVSAIALALGSLLFLLAPTFQQGLRITAKSWNLSESSWDKTLQRLAKTAEANHDGEALAYVAMGIPQSTQRDKFADEAVTLDPHLTWIYYQLLSRDLMYRPDQVSPNSARWLSHLEEWDPDNAAVYVLEGARVRPSKLQGWNSYKDQGLIERSPTWLNAMDKAFSATNYNSYLSRCAVLDRDVMMRYNLDEPSQMLTSIMNYRVLPVLEIYLYEKDVLLKAGDAFEEKGDFKHAAENYWKAEHLGELIQLHSDSDLEKMVAADLQLKADPRLEALYDRTGNSSAARLFAYQISALKQAQLRSYFEDRRVIRSLDSQFFNAAVVQIALVVMGASFLLILCWGFYFAARLLLRATKIGRLSRAASTAGIVGGIAFFVSNIVMYFGYGPYAEALQTYMAAPKPADARDSLWRFWTLQGMPSELLGSLQDPTHNANLWYAVIFIGCAIIVWILIRNIARTFRHSHPAPAAPSR